MVALLAVFLLGVVLALTHGIYQTDCVILLIAGFFACLYAWQCARSSFRLSQTVPLERLAPLFFSLVFLSMLSLDLELIYAQDAACVAAIRALTGSAALLTLLSLIFSIVDLRGDLQRIPASLVAAACLCLVLARCFVPFASPKPFIDVFWINTWAAGDFLGGMNPYSRVYPDIYKGAYGYQPGFTYWPAYLLGASATKLAGLDIRYLNLGADVAVGAVIGKLAKGNRQLQQMAWPLALLWLCIPTGFFVLEQAWVDTVLLALSALAFLCLNRRSYLLCGCLVALATATKQYGFIPGLVIAVAVLGRGGVPALMRFAVPAIILFCVLMLPFLFWNFGAFYSNTVGILIRIPMRTDSMTLPALLMNQWGAQIPGVALVGAYLCALILGVGTAFRHANSLPCVIYATAFVYAMLFLLGKQASCNYYQLVCGLILLGLASGSGEKEAA